MNTDTEIFHAINGASPMCGCRRCGAIVAKTKENEGYCPACIQWRIDVGNELLMGAVTCEEREQLTKREKFAAVALQGLLALFPIGTDLGQINIRALANSSYNIAAVMIEAGEAVPE